MHATKWMNLEKIMQSKRNLSQKIIYCRILFICNAQNRQIYTDKNKLMALGLWSNG